jgi:phage shock protein A
MADIGNISTELDLDSAQSQFRDAKNSIEKRTLLEDAKRDLSDNPTEILEAEIDAISLNAEIEERMKKLLATDN